MPKTRSIMAAENLTMSQLYDLLKTNLELVQKGREEDNKSFEELRAEDLKLTEEKFRTNEEKLKNITSENTSLRERVVELSGDNNAQTRTKRFDRLFEIYMKTHKTKDLQPLEGGVDPWINSVFEDISIICQTNHISVNDLTDKERVLILRSRLPYNAVSQLQAFCTREDVTFDDVSYSRFKEMLNTFFGKSIPPVNAVLNLFGPDRNMKQEDKTMVQHVLAFRQNLPTCLNVEETLGDLIKFKDLIIRSAFFASIPNEKVRNALIDIPRDTATYEEFTKVAIERAEQLIGYRTAGECLNKIQKDPAVAASADTTSVLRAGDYASNSGHKQRRNRGGHGKGGSNTYQAVPDHPGPLSDVICHGCGARGHIRPNCPSNPNKALGRLPNNSARMVDLIYPSEPSMSPPMF